MQDSEKNSTPRSEETKDQPGLNAAAETAAAPEQAHDMIRPPARMAHRPPEVGRQPGYRVYVAVASNDGTQNLFAQRFTNRFVGIDRKHPVAGDHIKRPILLRPETWPIGYFDVRTEFAADVDRSVGTAGIKHDDLVGKRHRAQTARDAVGLVLGDDDDGKLHVVVQRCAKRRRLLRESA